MIKKILLLSLLFLSIDAAVAQSDVIANQVSLAEQVAMYPNPAVNKIQISNETKNSLNVVVYNILGDAMLSKRISGDNNQIDITSLQAGIYIVSFTDGKRTTTKRLVKN